MSSRQKLGIWLTLGGLAIPAVTYIGGNLYMANLASYGGPPNQGAMVVAYLAFLASLGIGACVVLAGIVIGMMSKAQSISRSSG